MQVSFFRFFEGWFFQPGELDINAFVRWFPASHPHCLPFSASLDSNNASLNLTAPFLSRREFILRRGVPSSEMQNASYWVHLVSWIERQSDPNVLLLFFEDLKEDLPAHVRRVAQFMGYQVGLRTRHGRGGVGIAL
jgi:hypothetical protein